MHLLWLGCFEVDAAAVMSCGVNIIRQEERRDKRRGWSTVCLTHYSRSRSDIPSNRRHIVVCFMAQTYESLPNVQRNILLPHSGMLKLVRWSRNCPPAVILGRTGCPFCRVPEQFTSEGGLSRRMQAFHAMKLVCSGTQ